MILGMMRRSLKRSTSFCREGFLAIDFSCRSTSLLSQRWGSSSLSRRRGLFSGVSGSGISTGQCLYVSRTGSRGGLW